METPAASMMPSMTSRNTSGSSRNTKRLAMKAPDIRDQRAEPLEGHRFAQIEAERACRFGSEKRALAEAVKQKQRHAQGSGRNHDPGEVADHGAADRKVPQRKFQIVAGEPVP